MKWYLAKTEPSVYSIGDLEREDRAVWDGVTNPQAVKTIREMRPGDGVLIYHSGKETAIVGTARVMSEPRDDPKNPKAAVVELGYDARIEPPITLAEIKAAGLFDDWALVRQGRLSTMPVPEAFLTWMKAHPRNPRK